MKDAPDLLTGFVLKEVKHDSHNDVWQPVWGEEAEIVNHYNELRVCLKEETLVAVAGAGTHTGIPSHHQKDEK